jgi:1,4-dihydroxy-2-naphthoate octaprenyltransferase
MSQHNREAYVRNSGTGGKSAWLRELRAPFFTASIVPITLGAAASWYYSGLFNLWIFVLSLGVTICLHAGANVVNDYFDYKSGCDAINKEYVPMFSGGSRLLVEGILSPTGVYLYAMGFFVLGALSSLLLFMIRGWIIVVIVASGIITGYFYTTRLATRGIGELAVGLEFGPIAVIGSYFAQTGVIDFNPIWASIPVGLMIANILWINEVPDINADAQSGKKTLVARMGKRKAISSFKAILLLTYSAVILGVLLDFLPLLSLIALLTIPIAFGATKAATEYATKNKPLVLANAGMVKIHLMAGLLLAFAFVISRVLVNVLPRIPLLFPQL